MCGIFFSLSRTAPRKPNAALLESLQRRGPDSTKEHAFTITKGETSLHVYALSTVLSLRGSDVVAQPLVDHDTGSFLCWNGEAWRMQGKQVVGNDSESVFTELMSTSFQNKDKFTRREEALDEVIDLLASISGPYAFVYYDALSTRVYYGRDCLGRRSLLTHTDDTGDFVLSSLSESQVLDTWLEVESDGLYFMEPLTNNITLEPPSTKSTFAPFRTPYTYTELGRSAEKCLLLPFGSLNKSLPSTIIEQLTSQSDSIVSLERLLRRSLEYRIQNIRPNELGQNERNACNLAILFSGGLDCSILARLAHDLLDHKESIDLLNVAFHNPRIHKTSEIAAEKNSYELCPDRITGRATFAELQRVCPGRNWRFVAIDIPYAETLAHRSSVTRLMHPHNTEMDLSISYALYFAARGLGTAEDLEGTTTAGYATSARVLLSGLGADEVFAGYQRHATAFTRYGFQGLLDEVELDINRLGKRNLGRDDRVISNWSKEVRFPYLDEDFLNVALKAPIWHKCGFGFERQDVESSPQFEPGKSALRLLAWKLGMTAVASEKKRAIQFGSRTAKMESNKSKGTHVVS